MREINKKRLHAHKKHEFVLASRLCAMSCTSVAACPLLRLTWPSSYNAHLPLLHLYATAHSLCIVHNWLHGATTLVTYTSIGMCD